MPCPICLTTQAVTQPSSGGGSVTVQCVKCGSFHLGRIAVTFLEHSDWTTQQRSLISGYIRENPDIKILSHELEALSNLANPSSHEKALKLLKWLAKLHPNLGDHIDKPLPECAPGSRVLIDSKYLHYSIESIAVAWATRPSEVDYLFDHVLIGSKGWLTPIGGCTVVISELGWEVLPKGVSKEVATVSTPQTIYIENQFNVQAHEINHVGPQHE